MKALLQRVNYAQVKVDAELVGEIGPGILAFIGLEKNDDQAVADKLLERILAYRILADKAGKMNLSLRDTGGGLLLVSQFTLAAATDRGLRPGFSAAMPPAEANALYDYLVGRAAQLHENCASGQFAADMKVSLENDGPVTFLLEMSRAGNS
jgi:D-tyrosyl-tRNA(Tyr) deacylase